MIYNKADTPFPLYLAEDLDPEWFEPERRSLAEDLPTANERYKQSIYSNLACIRLEHGINQGSADVVQRALDNFTTLVNRPGFDIYFPHYFKAMAFLATRDVLLARAECETPSAANMSKAYSKTMDILDQLMDQSNKVGVRKQTLASYLIAFGALAAPGEADHFPYFSTFRESHDEASRAAHDVYVVGSSLGSSQKYPLSLYPQNGNPDTLDLNGLLQKTAKEHMAWSKDRNVPTLKHGDRDRDARDRDTRIKIFSRLVSEGSRKDNDLTAEDKLVLHTLGGHLLDAAGYHASSEGTAARSTQIATQLNRLSFDIRDKN